MTELEKRINELIGRSGPKNIVGKTLSGVKNTLNSSSNIVTAVNNFGDSLQDNIEDEIGGVTGAIGGWVAGTATKLTGTVAGGIVAGTLKTVAGIIPDSSDPKLPELDKKVAHLIDSYSIPSEKEGLIELLQFVWGTQKSTDRPFGKQTMSSLRNLHSRIYSTLQIVAKDDQCSLAIAKSYAPKKRFGIF